MLGSSMIALVRGSGQSGESIDAGFVELEYLASDKSVALLNDGEHAWQFLTADCYLELANGVRLDLATGELYYPTEAADGETSAYSVSLDGIDPEVATGMLTVQTDLDESGYPVYRFTVINGTDGEDGTDGADGEDGEDGESGDQGAEGATPGEATAGAEGSAGSTGNTGTSGASGGTMSGVKVQTTVPVVTMTSWVVDGRTLTFTAYMDETSQDSVVPDTTVITLTDLDTGDVYTWTTEDYMEYDFEDSGTVEFYTSVLTPGHEYRLSISLSYSLDDDEVVENAEIFSRVFTADDYGLSFDLVERTTSTMTFTMSSSNRLVDVKTVDIYVNGEFFASVDAAEFEDGGYLLDLTELEGYDGDYANQVWEISFQPTFSLTTYDSNGDATTSDYPLDSESVISYDYTITTLKEEPSVGGVSLSGYSSGYFLAQVLGIYDDGAYASVVDEDDAIESIRFELYDNVTDMNNATNAIATKTVTSGYVAYFEVDGETLTIGELYYLRAWYTYNDGEKTVETAVIESNPSFSYTYTDDAGETVTLSAGVAFDVSQLSAVTKSEISFRGDNATWNTADIYQTASEQDNDDGLTNGSGITFDSITGDILVTVSSQNAYVVSSSYPLELQISAEPDYYQSIAYTYFDATTATDGEVSLSTDEQIDPLSLSNYTTLALPIDLTGLKADTTYMFTLIGYVDNSGTYKRVTLGALSVSTSSRMEIEITLESSQDYYGDTGIGAMFWLGDDDATNYYASDSTYPASESAYWTDTDASYRNLYSITFYLYRGSTVVGYCTITDESDTYTVGQNTLYEMFYTEDQAVATLNSLGYSYGLVGVGRSSYPYYFTSSTTGLPLTLDALSSGNYTIKAVLAYDYTEYRYNEVEADPDAADLYDYYALSQEKSLYLNSMDLTGTAETEAMARKTTPYNTPTDYEGAITVTTMLNSDLGAYNEDDSDDSLYSVFWDESVVAGLKLDCNFVADGTGTYTTLFTYYGFSYTEWQDSVELCEDDTNKIDYPTQSLNSGGYSIEISFELEEGETSVPEVWLLFYNDEDVPYVDDAIGTDVYDTTDKGTELGTEITVNGSRVLIYYMSASSFYRGQSYVFAYEVEIEGYDYETGSYSTGSTFNYPMDYYEKVTGASSYSADNTLRSEVISVERQAPVVYSSLSSSTTTAADETAGTEEQRKDTWLVYVNDPDDAIVWKTMLGTGDDTVRLKGDGSATLFGGIWTVFDSYVSGQLDQLVFSFSTGHTLTTGTSYAETERTETDQLLQNELTSIAAALTNHVADEDEPTTLLVTGSTVTVSGLLSDGGSYELLVDYTLLDDADTQTYESVKLIQHFYTPYSSYEEDGSDALSMDADLQEDDNDTVRIYLDAPTSTEWVSTDATELATEKQAYYMSSDYVNQASMVTLVYLKAYNEENDEMILARDDDGNIVDEEQTLTLVPNAPTTTDISNGEYRYYLEFSLSDLDDSVTETQFSAGEVLSFQMEIYYATGDSSTNSGNTSQKVALKYVNRAMSSKLYSSSTAIELPYWAHTTSGLLSYSYKTAAGSLFDAKLTVTAGTSIPWTQKLSLVSAYYDYGTFTSTSQNAVTLSSAEGYSTSYRTVLELMSTASYTIAYDGDYATAITVGTAIPTLQDIETVGGLSSIQLTAVVNNWNRVEYTDETFHLYYLVYSYDGVDETLVGALVGTDLSSGDLSLLLEDLTLGTDYHIYVYYKKAIQDIYGDYYTDTDSTLLQGIMYERGTFYIDVAQGTGSVASQIAEVLKSTDNSFTAVSGGNPVECSTGSGVAFSSVVLTDLGDSPDPYSYETRTLTAMVTVNESATALLENEVTELQLCYALQRQDESDTGGTWDTVLSNMPDSSSEEWTEYGTLSQTSTSAYNANGEVYLGGTNYLTFTYRPGGVIVPGYTYRLVAAVYSTDTANTWMMAADDLSDDSLYSDGLTWSSFSLSSLIQTTTPTRTNSSFTLSFRLNDANSTSFDQTYYVRVAQYDDTDEDWDLLDDIYSYSMGTTMTVTFSELDKGETYRLQFYALMDTNYNGYLDIADNGTQFATDSKTDAASNTLTENDICDDAYLAGYGPEVTLLSTSATASAGEKIYSITKTSDTTLTVRFTGAYNAAKIAQVSWMLSRNANEDTDDDGETWTVVDMVRSETGYSLFSSVSTSNDEHGTDGTIYLLLDLDDALANVATVGIYTLQINTYDDSGSVLDTYTGSLAVLQ